MIGLYFIMIINVVHFLWSWIFKRDKKQRFCNFFIVTYFNFCLFSIWVCLIYNYYLYKVFFSPWKMAPTNFNNKNIVFNSLKITFIICCVEPSALANTLKKAVLLFNRWSIPLSLPPSVVIFNIFWIFYKLRIQARFVF